jgi:hypothetical protein
MLTMSKKNTSKFNENESDSDSEENNVDGDHEKLIILQTVYFIFILSLFYFYFIIFFFKESVLPSKIISNLKVNTAQEFRNKPLDTRSKNQHKNDEANHQDIIYKLKSQHNEELENYKYKESMYKKSAEKLEESNLHLENKILEITKDNNEIKKAKDIEISSLKSICQDSSLEISVLMSRVNKISLCCLLTLLLLFFFFY